MVYSVPRDLSIVLKIIIHRLLFVVLGLFFFTEETIYDLLEK